MTKKPTNIQEGLDDYNPFADPTSQQRPGTVSEEVCLRNFCYMK